MVIFIYERCVIQTALTPLADKNKIQDIILADPYILSLGYNIDNVYQTDTTTADVQKDNYQIFIFNAPSRKNYANEKTMEVIIQIDVVAPESESYVADYCVEQIIALLQDKDIGNGSRLETDAQSLSVPHRVNGFYTISARFSYCVSKYNKIKTVD